MQYVSIAFLLSVITHHATDAQQTNRRITAPASTRRLVGSVTPATYTGRQVLVGSGGGVTGASTTYYLLETGQLFGRRSRDSTFTFIGRQPVAQTKRLFSTVETTCRIRTTRFDNPGNRYQFVGWRRGKQAYKVTWGEPGTTPPASYPQVYKTFMAMIPAAKRL